jgi:hypothetical protein
MRGRACSGNIQSHEMVEIEVMMLRVVNLRLRRGSLQIGRPGGVAGTAITICDLSREYSAAVDVSTGLNVPGHGEHTLQAITSVPGSRSPEVGSRPKPAQRVERSESLDAAEASLTMKSVMVASTCHCHANDDFSYEGSTSQNTRECLSNVGSRLCGQWHSQSTGKR